MLYSAMGFLSWEINPINHHRGICENEHFPSIRDVQQRDHPAQFRRCKKLLKLIFFLSSPPCQKCEHSTTLTRRSVKRLPPTLTDIYGEVYSLYLCNINTRKLVLFSPRVKALEKVFWQIFVLLAGLPCGAAIRSCEQLANEIFHFEPLIQYMCESICSGLF